MDLNDSVLIGFAVVGTWVILAGMRRWRFDGSWTDRIGVLIGLLWLCATAYRVVTCFFIPFGNWGY